MQAPSVAARGNVDGEARRPDPLARLQSVGMIRSESLADFLDRQRGRIVIAALVADAWRLAAN